MEEDRNEALLETFETVRKATESNQTKTASYAQNLASVISDTSKTESAMTALARVIPSSGSFDVLEFESILSASGADLSGKTNEAATAVAKYLGITKEFAEALIATYSQYDLSGAKR